MERGQQYTMRLMKREELDLAVDWAALEGWNPGLSDAECFFSTDPEGFLIGYLNDEPISCISVVSYGPEFGFLGFYIVRPEYRGKGFGISLWNLAIKHLGDCNIGLDGVVAEQANYAKSGFHLAYRNIRYEGSDLGGGQESGGSGIVDLVGNGHPELVEYDSNCFGVPRASFLEYWLKQPHVVALAKVQAGRLIGYGVIRPCREGYKIGPLFADDEGSAETLFLALCNRAGGSKVYLDVPEANSAAVSLADRHGMKIVFETARMYTKTPPNITLSKVYGVTSFELG